MQSFIRRSLDYKSDKDKVNTMEKAKIDRINELARIAKTRELTSEEAEERRLLREEYLNEFRRSLRGDGEKQ